jgi:glycine cleavage system H protein
MPENLEFTLDKFTFRVATDCLYSLEGVWAKAEPKGVRIGLSDFLQQRSGDVAFAEVKPVGTSLSVGDEVAVIETIKVDISLGAPLSGKIIAVNPDMETAPEAINQDPYQAGWLAFIEPTDWESDRLQLIEPQTYLEKIKIQAEQEVKKG